MARVTEDNSNGSAVDLKVVAVQVYRKDLASFRFQALEPGRLKLHGWHPGQVAALATDEHAPSYFAIASAPEEKDSVEFLVKRNTGISVSLLEQGLGATAQLTGPFGRGFPAWPGGPSNEFPAFPEPANPRERGPHWAFADN